MIVELHYPSDSTFFGLGFDYKPIIHKEIFYLVYNGGGGFSFSDVYNMPVWLRRFHIKCLNDTLKERREHMEEQKKEVQRKTRKR